ncbi:hydroxyacid dehydrogenase [Candidatus Woesearchaeota archaeon]|nr:hydroxyacid dehydrogenase [Candidatus Woesearchaeota archaeon]
MHIAFFEVKAWEKDFLKEKLKKYQLTFFTEPLSEKNIVKAKQADIVSVLIYSHITDHMLSSLPKLKMLLTRSTGYDHIDVAACRKRGITVCNIPSYGESTVAEHTFALILALSRKITKAYAQSLNNDFSLEGLQGFDLKEKTLGVMGTGRIGLEVIRIAKGFGMNVLAYDMYPQENLAQTLDFHYCSLDQLLKNSDIITLHVPYNKETHHLINKNTLQKVKRGDLLINTARGAVVDTEALITALRSGRLAGAGLDVLEGEECLKEENHSDKKYLKKIKQLKTLLGMDNVIITPHIAFYSKEAVERRLQVIVENIVGFIAGREQNVVK